MSGTYEYLMSSLPNLSFQNSNEQRQRVVELLKKYAGQASEHLSIQQIINEEAGKFLPVSVYKIFEDISLNSIHEERFQKQKIKVLSHFSIISNEIKSVINIWRSSPDENEKKGAKKKLDTIVGDGTPLEKELQLMKYQWNKVEEYSTGHFTDLEAIFAYKIKLLILLRMWSFDAEKGFATFNRVTKEN